MNSIAVAPSQDLDQVSRFERLVFDAEAAHSDTEAAFMTYAGLRLEIWRARSALELSQQRYQAAAASLQELKGRPALARKLVRQQIAQLDAIVHNSVACAELGEEQVALAPRLNAEWERLSQELRKLPPPTPEQMVKAAADVREASLTMLREKFKLTDQEMAMLSARTQEAPAAPATPQPIPSVLLDEQWQQAASAMAAQHRKGAELFARMKQALEAACGGR